MLLEHSVKKGEIRNRNGIMITKKRNLLTCFYKEEKKRKPLEKKNPKTK